MEALRSLPAEAQLEAVSGLTQSANIHDNAVASYNDWTARNPNTAMVAGAVVNAAEKIGSNQKSSTNSEKSRNKPPTPLSEAEGRAHTIIERPGREGQYTTHYADGSWKQYRGSGKPHGNIDRPNVKEMTFNINPNDGKKHPKIIVRKPEDWEMPKSK